MRLHVTYGTESEPESARVSYPVSGWLVEIPHSGTRVEIAATCVSRTLWLRVVYARLSLSFHPGPRSRPVMVFMHTAWTQHASAALLFYILVYITHICVSYSVTLFTNTTLHCLRCAHLLTCAHFLTSHGSVMTV